MASDAIDWHEQIAEAFDQGYARSALFKERLRVWQALIEDHVPADASVLDAGCGPGLIAILAARRAKSVVALYGSEAMLSLARQNAQRAGCHNLEFAHARLDDATPPDRQAGFDAILSSSVLEYVDGIGEILDTFARQLRPHGVLIVSLPNRQSIYRRLEVGAFAIAGRPRYLAHVRHVWTVDRLATELASRDLTVVQRIYYGAVPGLSVVCRGLGLPHYADTLFALVAKKA